MDSKTVVGVVAGVIIFIAMSQVVLLQFLNNTSPGSDPDTEGWGLRKLADPLGFEVGTAINNYWAFHSDQKEQYQDTLLKNFNSISLEYSIATDEVWLGPGNYSFTYADQAVEFASNHSISVAMTHLVWHGSLPEWLEQGNFTAEEVRALVRQYIQDVMNHYREGFGSAIRLWNVVNEVVEPSWTSVEVLRETFYSQMLGESYVEDLFRWAHELDPKALLFINDYGILGNPSENQFKLDRLAGLVENLLEKDVPIHGVGFQGHLSVEDEQDFDYYRSAIQQFGEMGLEVRISELDILINNDLAGRTQKKLQEQAILFGEVYSLCVEEEACSGVTTWGFNDAHSYLNTGYASWLDQEEDWPLLFEEDYTPKEAYAVVHDILSSHYSAWLANSSGGSLNNPTAFYNRESSRSFPFFRKVPYS